METNVYSMHFHAYTPGSLRLVSALTKLKRLDFNLQSKLKFNINKCKTKNIFILRSHHGHSQYANEHLEVKVWKGTLFLQKVSDSFIQKILLLSQPGITLKYRIYTKTYTKKQAWGFIN